jgi:eukaryotic-like serine/threonine-protein kinase
MRPMFVTLVIMSSDAEGEAPTLAEPVAAVARAQPRPAARYVFGETLGQGGMGEVLSARDEQVGRSVAIKRLRDDRPSAQLLARFMREARIQGRLDHPSIVPVHEISSDQDGHPFFVMKQLAGTTLSAVLSRLDKADTDTVAQFSRQRLLRVFADICLAIEFAHTRGVVHRDLKPSNIMIGDFGDVCVLDWGIARVIGDPVEPSSLSDVDPGAGPQTVHGAILGTPGYLAPEQFRGDPSLDGRADIYALGCILYELLCFRSLHPPTHNLTSIVFERDARPSLRTPDRDIPPELDAICVRATALDPADRFQSARDLGAAVQRFLDGDRDLELRRSLARRELAAARTALDTDRPAAIGAAARALALDPTAREPAELVGALMLEPPKQVPAEVDDELRRNDLLSLHRSARFGLIASLAYLAAIPLMYLIGIRTTWFYVGAPCVVALIVYAETVVVKKNPFVSGYLGTGGHLVLLAMLSTTCSPFVIGATPAVIIVMLLASHPVLVRTWVLAGLAVIATLLPFLLRAFDLIPPFVRFEGGAAVFHTLAGELQPEAALATLVLYAIGMVALATVVSRAQDDERRRDRRMLQIQAWQLRQLLPRPSA